MHPLRFATAGSVDDGKSTLIGRLLYDARAIQEDQLAALEQASVRRGGPQLDLSLLTDGLEAEREQGITIDVAYRYFATPARKFIIADSPGHEQYTRNMATGASNADAIVLLLDVEKGLLPQTRRHALIARLLGIRRAVVFVNKMDRVAFSKEIFGRVKDQVVSFAQPLEFESLDVIPGSALNGDMVVERGDALGWYAGPTLLERLVTLPAGTERAAAGAEKSYTRKLLDKGIAHCAKKLGEEAVETALAAVGEDRDHLIAETADLLYHLLVVLEARGVSLAEVEAVLAGRMVKSGLEEKASRSRDR